MRRALLVALLLAAAGCTHKTITYLDCRRTNPDGTVDTLDHITWADTDCIEAYRDSIGG